MASSAIAIPKRKHQERGSCVRSSVDSAASSRSRSSSSAGGLELGCGSYGSVARASSASPRRSALMSATFCKAEHTVVDVGEEEHPRLISCVKASQGFAWNQEMFLPSSYAAYLFDDLERRQDPVQDIVLTDEEVENMFPS